MTFGNYFRAALLLPLLVGLACLAALYGYVSGGENGLIFFTGMSMRYGGIPYVCFLIVVYGWSLRRSDAQIKRRYWLFPLLYLPFLVPVPFVLFGPSGSFADALAFIAFTWAFALAYAYGYALLIYGGWVLLEKRHAKKP